MTRTHALYILCAGAACFVSLVLTPVMRRIAIRFSVMDKPDLNLKTHGNAVPYLGGVAIVAGFIVSLAMVRFLTHFPTGTLKAIRGIFFGTILLTLVGLVDDTETKGMGFKVKFALQTLVGLILILFDVRIKFAHPEWLSFLLTLIWVIGITNALNLTDIMDGLAGGIAVIASLAFLLISLPTEEIYVNFASAALAGACLGFLPYNLSKKHRIFMGDTGSLAVGFILAALSMGTSYTKINNMGLFSPILILILPIFDTIFVSIVRMSKGKSPFLGSKDHFPLRLRASGLSQGHVLAFCYMASIIAAFGAYLLTKVSFVECLSVAGISVALLALFAWHISHIEVV